MSTVTIKELYWELNSDASNKSWDDAKEIEIVPRKIVEMIIDRCVTDVNDSDWRYSADKGKICEAADIKEYAESLLKQFEEDAFNESDTHKSSEHEQPTPCTENVRLISCPKCGGTGYETGTDGFDIVGDCERCNGTGKVSC